jgi:hypothetical protein
VGRNGLPIREPQRPIRESRCDRGFFSRGRDPDWPAGAQINRDQRVSGRRQPQRGSRARELDNDRAAFERRDASDPQLGIVAVGEVVPRFPGACRC